MKKVLVTWYGITDLNSSFKTNLDDGPILGALKAEEYSNVLILGFTNLEKTSLNKDSFKIEETAIQEQLKKNKDTNLIKSLIYKYANTEFAHKNYVSWLMKQLNDKSIKTKLSFRQVELTHLNDTEGIYSNAIKALDNILSKDPDIELSLYLSPGTPVMAFVWAFVSMRYPTTKIKLLVSSKPGFPPENISLPNEWIDWHGKQISSDNDYENFDVIYHLLGEQKMPSLLGIRQFKCDKHIFLSSKQYSADALKYFIGESSLNEINIEPYDPENIRIEILNNISTMDKNLRIGFNLTGGTKLMYAGALAACRKVNGIPFYFDGKNRELVYLDNFKNRIPIKEIDDVETYIKLNSNFIKISNSGQSQFSEDKLELTKLLWQKRTNISKLYKQISEFNDKEGKPFRFTSKDIYIELTSYNEARITIGLNSFNFTDFPNFARYISGGWFEDYVFYRLQPYIEKGIIKDVRLNFEVSYGDINYKKDSRKKTSKTHIYQEFDLLFTDGNKLFIIECKAGHVKSEYIRKLESITREYGGVTAIGILACCFKPHNKVVAKKAEESRNVKLFAAKDLFDDIENLLVP